MRVPPHCRLYRTTRISGDVRHSRRDARRRGLDAETMIAELA
jgi:hypothetical protein